MSFETPCCIEVSDLRVVFPNGHEALKSISLGVPRGQFVCVIGRSGAGKSTLLRTINGLLQPTSGAVVDDTSVTGASGAAAGGGSASSSRSSTWSIGCRC